MSRGQVENGSKNRFCDESHRGTDFFPSGKCPSLSRRWLLELGQKGKFSTGPIWSFKLVTIDITE